MASGMGMPSMGIYSYELFNGYDVENIIRIGTAGALSGRSASAGSGIWHRCLHKFEFCGTVSASRKLCSNGIFSTFERKQWKRQKKGRSALYGRNSAFFGYILQRFQPGCELAENGRTGRGMEAAALYMNAARTGKQALAICTISDSIVYRRGDKSTEREKSFHDMMELALEDRT